MRLLKIIAKHDMYQMQPLEDFFSAIADNPRINTTHISLYMALLKLWREKGFQNPVNVFSHEVMTLCKVSGVATYHKKIRELHNYGYIRYVPSFYRCARSCVYMIKTEIIDDSGILTVKKF